MKIHLVEIHDYSDYAAQTFVDSAWQYRPNADFRASGLTDRFSKEYKETGVDMFASVRSVDIEDWNGRV